MKVAILVLLFAGAVIADLCSNGPCAAGQSCCQTSSNTAACYGDGADTRQCITNNQGGLLLCPAGMWGCGQGCYYSTDVVPACAAGSACAAAGCAGAGKSCCYTATNQAACYGGNFADGTPDTRVCISNGNGALLLCDANKLGCGNDCYDPNVYTCNGGTTLVLIAPGTCSSSGSAYCTAQSNNHQCCKTSSNQEVCYGDNFPNGTPDTRHCVTNNDGGALLCDADKIGCVAGCYPAASYSCNGGVLTQI